MSVYPSPSEAELLLKSMASGDTWPDHDRLARTGEPEVVLAESKTPRQCADAVAALLDGPPEAPVLVTRAGPEHAEAVLERAPSATYEPEARLIVARAARPKDAPRGVVAVVTAGTSDLPVARECLAVLRAFGVTARLVTDVGVAGLHRTLSSVDELGDADVVVAVAGMEGALPTVLAGLLSQPVVAVPTSVGYGASFDGLAALLSMLSSCAPGVSVVNIDNGFGAAMVARRILRVSA